MPVFLSVIVDQTYRILTDLTAPNLLEEKSFAELDILLKAHYDPKPLVIDERCKSHCQRRLTLNC